MNNILFIHVPKTGGTSLNEIISANFVPSEKLSDLTGFSGENLEIAVNSDKFKYISGHVPSGIFAIEKFTHRITVLRDPRDIIVSLNQFSRRHNYSNPRFIHSVTSGEVYEIYRTYFSQVYDLRRHLIDMRHGIFGDIHEYAGVDYSVDKAISRLHEFNWIIDFSCLEDTAKTLIVDLGLFPLREVPRRRFAKYQPDLEFGERLLSSFDREFYARSRELFVKKIVGSVEYENYRQGYPGRAGFQLAPNTGLNYSLNGTVGQGWHSVEISGNGNLYRWSETHGVTIEIPIMHPGVYEIYFYTRNSPRGKLLGLQPEVDPNVSVLEQEEILHRELIVTKSVLKLISPGWVNYAVQVEVLTLVGPVVDDRKLGISLSDIYIFRRDNDC